MKRLVLATALVAAGVTALAQGSLDFSNFKTTSGINAPVFRPDGVTKLGSAYLGQLYAGPVGGSLNPIGAPVAFRDSAGVGTGYIVAGKVLVTGVAEGAKASVVFKAWEAAGGNSFEAAAGSGKLYGQSAMLEITTGGDNLSPPAVPAPLVGLTSFSLIPEPSTLALGMLGAAALLLRRRS